MICLFVQFYWTLSHDLESATRIMQAERKRQGFGGFLEERPSKRGDTLVSTAELTKHVHPKQTSQIGDDAFQSPSKKVPGIPRDIKFQKNSNAKKDVPACPEQEGKSSSQTCPPSLDPASSSVTRQIEHHPSTLPLPLDSQDTTTICDLPKKRKGRQINPDRRRTKHRKINEATSDIIKSRNDVIDEKTEARPSQREDKADHVSNGALCGQPQSIKTSGSIPRSLKFKKIKNLNTEDVPGHPEREGKSSSQTCPPSLDPTSLSATREIESNSSTLPLTPDSQNTSDLPTSRKRQTSPDTPRKKHRGINEATSDASKLGDNNNLEPQFQAWSYFEWKEDTFSLSCPPVASSISESTRIELDETVLSLSSSAPVPKIHDPQGGVGAYSAQGKQKSRSNFKATKTSVLAPRPKDATRQSKQYGTTNNPKKRRASSSEGHQCQRQDAPVDQEDSVPIIVRPALREKKRGRLPKVKEEQEDSASTTMQLAPVRPLKSQAQSNAGIVVPFSGQNVNMTQETSITSCISFSPAQCERQEVPVQQDFVQPDLAKKKRGRRPKLKEGQEGSASITMQPASGRKIDRHLKSQAQLNAGTVVSFSGQNVDITQVTPITFCIPFSPAQSYHAVSGLQETAEGLLRHDHVPWSMLDRDMKEETENWLWTQGHSLVEEDSTLDCEAPAATQMEDRPTDIFPAQKPPLCVNPPIWAQVRDNTLRYNKLSSAFLSSPAKKFVKPLIGSEAIKVVFILRTMQ